MNTEDTYMQRGANSIGRNFLALAKVQMRSDSSAAEHFHGGVHFKEAVWLNEVCGTFEKLQLCL